MTFPFIISHMFRDNLCGLLSREKSVYDFWLFIFFLSIFLWFLYCFPLKFCIYKPLNMILTASWQWIDKVKKLRTCSLSVCLVVCLCLSFPSSLPLCVIIMSSFPLQHAILTHHLKYILLSNLMLDLKKKKILFFCLPSLGFCTHDVSSCKRKQLHIKVNVKENKLHIIDSVKHLMTILIFCFV